MPKKWELSMRTIRELLRLALSNPMSARTIGRSLRVSHLTGIPDEFRIPGTATIIKLTGSITLLKLSHAKPKTAKIFFSNEIRFM